MNGHQICICTQQTLRKERSPAVCDSVDELKGQIILCDVNHRRALKWSQNQGVEWWSPGLEGGRGGNVIQQRKVTEVENGYVPKICV